MHLVMRHHPRCGARTMCGTGTEQGELPAALRKWRRSVEPPVRPSGRVADCPELVPVANTDQW